MTVEVDTESTERLGRVLGGSVDNGLPLFSQTTPLSPRLVRSALLFSRRHPAKLEDGQQKAEQGEADADHAVVKEREVIHGVVLAE